MYKVYQLLAQGRWFSPGTPTSSTAKTGRYDIAEILLKVPLKHQKSNQNLVTWHWLQLVLLTKMNVRLHVRTVCPRGKISPPLVF
jgi:hypothetical protein